MPAFRRPCRAAVLAPAAVLSLAVPLAACADGSASASPDAAGSRPSAAQPALQVGVAGTHFTGVPATVHAGSRTMAFSNRTAAVHMAAIARFADGHTAADLPAYLASPEGQRGLPSWLDLVGGVDELDGGHRASWTGSLDPGSYAIVSFSPDTQGRPEIADGMLAPFAVRGDDGPAIATPQTGGTVTLGAGATLTMTPIAAGTTALGLVNDDSTARTVDIAAIKPGRTFDDVVAEAQQGNGVPTSLVRLGGTVVPAHGSAIAGIESAVAGTTYVVFDIDHVGEGAIAHETVR